MAVPTQGAYRPFGGLATEKVRSTLVDGLPVSMPGGTGPTDANGFVEIGAPARLVEIEAGARDRTGRASVSAAAGATVPLEIVLQAGKGP